MDLSGPGGTILIINGDEMILHYKALKKTERHQLSRDIRSKAIAEHLFLLLDANPESLSKTYTIKVVQASPLKIQLTPKAEALRKLIATIDAEISNRGYVAQLVLNESNGDKTRWRFTDPVLNTPLDGALFTFP
jgi:outer membrane lipoprotein-sorting protein